MAFNLTPGTGRNNLKPAMTPISQFQPQMEMSNSGRQAKVVQSNANASTNTKSGRSGKRTGGKVTRNKYKSFDLPVAVAPNNRQNSASHSSLNITSSDFGFDVNGSASPTPYNDKRDQTLFRDYNQRSTLEDGDNQLNTNNVTNSLKLLEINLKDSLYFPGAYGEAWDVIRNCITRDIVSNTKSAKGAVDLIDDIVKYFSSVSSAFDLLIELEVMQAWSPSSNDYYNRSYRALAELTTTPEILEQRARLRQALIPHVLPLEWMNYIKWVRETKLENSTPESVKQRFISSNGALLMNAAFNGATPVDWKVEVDNTIQALNNLNSRIPATLLSNVNSVNLKNVKEYYTGVHNSAVFDADYNDVFNNRVIYWELPDGSKMHYPKRIGEPCYAAFSSETPISMAVAGLFRQRGGYGLPIEGPPSTVKVGGQGLGHNTFQITEEESPSTGSTHTIRGLEKWYEFVDNTTHIIDINTDGSINYAISTPKGTDVVSFVADTSNMAMAARESFTAMTLSGY